MECDTTDCLGVGNREIEACRWCMVGADSLCWWRRGGGQGWITRYIIDPLITNTKDRRGRKGEGLVVLVVPKVGRGKRQR